MRAWSLTIMCSKAALVLVLFGGLLLGGEFRHAAAAPPDSGPAGRSVLVIYSTGDGTVDAAVHILDLALGHFSDSIVFKSDREVAPADVRGVSHLVYYGEISRELPPQAKQIIASFSGPLLAVGENLGQLGERFSFLAIRCEDGIINKVSKDGSETYELLTQNFPVTETALREGSAPIMGWRGDYPVPLFAVNGNTGYFASAELDAPFINYLAEGLYRFFQTPLPAQRLAYIRLEDVHPFSDPGLVKAAGDYLAGRNIPYMIAVIPVYTNPQTLRQYHLKDKPELVRVLRELQQGGASIVLHGYTHQYRNSETGEGFEFWDVLNNTPVSAPADQSPDVPNRPDISSQAGYQAYLDQRKQFDRTYAENRLIRGIRELTELGLRPLGFEAPHYTASQEDYRVFAEYFPCLLGQTQLDDRDWRHMSTSPYITRPSFLHGMTLLPETIGYYDPSSLSPIGDMEEKIRQMQFVDGGVIGMFYHPYLGVDGLKSLISRVQKIPDLQWIDLKSLDFKATAKYQAVERTASSGSENDAASSIAKDGRKDPLQIVLWGISAVVSVMVALFFLYTIRIRLGLRKQLFGERKLNG